ncbi:MAG: protein O-mannosyl-transferase family [Anaerolineae bacterium]
MITRRYPFVDSLIALGVGLVAFVFYLRTMAPDLLWGDPGEFQFAAWLAGLAHPTGYPLYLTLGWLWTHLLPWGDPAWQMNLFSALWGGVAVGLVYLLAARLLLRGDDFGRPGWPVRLLAAAGALIFAGTPTFWSQAVVAEVYTLHTAFVAAILLAAIAWADNPRPPELYLLAGLVGLSLAHHRSTLLLLPGLALFLAFSRRSKPAASHSRSHLLVVLALLLAPLLLYLYIPWRATQTPYLVLNLAPDQQLRLYEPTLRGFLNHVSGSVFRSLLGRGRAWWPSELGQRLVGELSWAGIALGVAGVTWSARRERLLLLLTGLTFLASVVFNHFYGIGDIFVFYIPAYLIWTLWMVLGLWACAQAIAGAGRQVGIPVAGWSFLAVGILALSLAGWQIVRSFAANDRSRDHAARAIWEAILAQPIPADTILISNDRDEMVPFWYLKYVEGRRPDLDGLFPLIQPGPAWSDVAAVIDQALDTGRPVYLVKPMPGLEAKFDLAPAADGKGIGALVQVLGPAGRGESAHTSGAMFGEQLRLHSYEVQPAGISGGATLLVTLYWDVLVTPEHDYTTFVHLVNANGQVVGQSDHRPGGVYYPTNLWHAGDRLRDRHQLAIAADPGPQPYTLVVGLYRLAPDLQHLGSPQEVGQLTGG